VTRNFSQTFALRSDEPDTLIALVRAADEFQASQEVMGYMGTRILADRDDPGRYLMISDFGVVDPSVSAAQEAFVNNERPETQAFAESVRAASKGDIEWHHYDELYRTDFA
jgi:hypothetical protein